MKNICFIRQNFQCLVSNTKPLLGLIFTLFRFLKNSPYSKKLFSITDITFLVLRLN